jgi:putative endonuclease
MAHYVYILKSMKDQKFYIGESADVQKRLIFHNSGLQRSTRNRIPFIILHIETFESKSEALKREKQIKSWKGGEAFKQLIGGM